MLSNHGHPRSANISFFAVVLWSLTGLVRCRVKIKRRLILPLVCDSGRDRHRDETWTIATPVISLSAMFLHSFANPRLPLTHAPFVLLLKSRICYNGGGLLSFASYAMQFALRARTSIANVDLMGFLPRYCEMTKLVAITGLPEL